MVVRFHPHALQRLSERGVTRDETIAAIKFGERFQAEFGRTGFRMNFPFDAEWQGRRYATKQVEVYAAREGADLMVITVISRYF